MYDKRSRTRGTSVKRSSLKDYESRKRRRRTSLVSRIKYKRPTAFNQKKQLTTLARSVARNSKYLRQQRVYTDYQWGQADQRGITASLNNALWYGWKLTDVTQWEACLRQDANTAQSSITYALRMQLNCRANLGTVTKLTYLNVFVISARPDDVEGLNITDNVGGMTQLVPNIDFVEQTANEGANIRLNSGKFKVLACKYMTLLPNTAQAAVPANAAAGNPFSTWRKWQWNIPLKFSIRMPSNRPWTNVLFEDMPYYEKLYFLVYSTSDPSDTNPNIYADALISCLNYS